MKKIILPLALAAALPLFAGEPDGVEASAARNDQAASVAQPVDSPLVQAAKRSKGAPKPKLVITNETLKKMGANARVTTTTSQFPVTVPDTPVRSAEVVALEQAAAKRAEAGKQAEEKKAAAAKKQTAQEVVAAATEDGEGVLHPEWLDEQGNLPDDFDPENPPEPEAEAPPE